MASYSDDFSGDLSAWSETNSASVDFQLLSGQLRGITNSGGSSFAILRYDTALDTVNHFSQIDFVSADASILWFFPCVNVSAAADTGYVGRFRQEGSLCELRSQVAGASTVLASNSSGTAPPVTLRLTRNGSDLIVAANGSNVLEYEIIGGGLSGLHAGVNCRGNFTGGLVVGDNWSAEDLAAGGPTIAPYGSHLISRQFATIAASRLDGVLQ